ncbi:hypothetical protein DPMN_034415 [Dreissena polymorpha]|uniref:Uncharacterized protein n=1 Tax=Dreissena polymorpha TaxID=45954 RepID=A0A9D4M7V8_DREPO|nr:hypothetical protein DPMN_034415 [Dreissena polymorpha]
MCEAPKRCEALPEMCEAPMGLRPYQRCVRILEVDTLPEMYEDPKRCETLPEMCEATEGLRPYLRCVRLLRG